LKLIYNFSDNIKWFARPFIDIVVGSRVIDPVSNIIQIAVDAEIFIMIAYTCIKNAITRQNEVCVCVSFADL
jgi:hypothetical protein